MHVKIQGKGKQAGVAARKANSPLDDSWNKMRVNPEKTGVFDA